MRVRRTADVLLTAAVQCWCAGGGGQWQWQRSNAVAERLKRAASKR